MARNNTMANAAELKGRLRGLKNNYKSDVEWFEGVKKDAMTPGSKTASKSYRLLGLATRYMESKRRR